MPGSDPHDKTLGMNERISRRDFLNSTLLASGALLMSSVSPAQVMAQDDWTGYGGVGDYSKSNGNAQAVLDAGHRIRDGEFDDYPFALSGRWAADWNEASRVRLRASLIRLMRGLRRVRRWRV